MMQFNDHGLVLRWSPLRERDATGLILSQHHGLFFVIAKGAMKSRKRLGGSVDLFHHIGFHAQAKGPSGPVFLNEAQLHNPFFALRQSYDRFWMASFCTKVVLEMMEAHLEERATSTPFLLLGSVFQWLSEGSDGSSSEQMHLWIGCVFLIQWYQHMGLFPDLGQVIHLFQLKEHNQDLWRMVMENPLSHLIRNQQWRQLPPPAEAVSWFDALSKFKEGSPSGARDDQKIF